MYIKPQHHRCFLRRRPQWVWCTCSGTCVTSKVSEQHNQRCHCKGAFTHFLIQPQVAVGGTMLWSARPYWRPFISLGSCSLTLNQPNISFLLCHTYKGLLHHLKIHLFVFYCLMSSMPKVVVWLPYMVTSGTQVWLWAQKPFSFNATVRNTLLTHKN